ncbi:TetR/AcrR family transcriptional regulator [Arthrobacter sp. zg-Y20]|uniref:TetR/AcrR family transcriptional regulator n=1 Tax=unclassified Arthrobacter TaxID=235627 RepID=UPI001D14B279|nr:MULTISPECIES: TetR/AcrR family transcriptional regulator [unclassified Arthrobacter]MCC3275470.1 TetR/AcrR family transcriptional regulator [Arthrobacter sp. zg-Y20]MDK1315627.1 helix-turn-helix domain-containing protein [Arthrobacter sp. zg.Y20]WIB06041.1 helix-turn-helix domain-containing protein [Arthrobacter sp. zg-Y20]
MEASQPVPSGIRGDAERNRLRLLEEARELVAAGGADALTMEALARRAGLGKGTVFRRFGSRSGLMQALLEHVEAGFRADWMSGPPPLGPGAPALARLQAFGSARLSLLMVNSELARAADVDPRTRYRNPSRALAVAHLAGLLREAGRVRDPELAAYQLAAFLDAGLLLHLRGEAGMDQTRLEQGWTDLVAALVRA